LNVRSCLWKKIPVTCGHIFSWGGFNLKYGILEKGILEKLNPVYSDFNSLGTFKFPTLGLVYNVFFEIIPFKIKFEITVFEIKMHSRKKFRDFHFWTPYTRLMTFPIFSIRCNLFHLHVVINIKRHHAVLKVFPSSM